MQPHCQLISSHGLIHHAAGLHKQECEARNKINRRHKIMFSLFPVQVNKKHILDETKFNIQFIASGQGNIGRSEAEPNIILYGCNELDVGRGQVQ